MFEMWRRIMHFLLPTLPYEVICFRDNVYQVFLLQLKIFMDIIIQFIHISKECDSKMLFLMLRILIFLLFLFFRI